MDSTETTEPGDYDDLNAAVVANLEEAIAGYTQSAEKWRPHLLRNDSLGECARRVHLKCLAKRWQAEQQLADLKGYHR